MKKLLVVAAALLIGMQANAQLIFNGGYLHATENSTFTENLASGDVTVSGSDMPEQNIVSALTASRKVSALPPAPMCLSSLAATRRWMFSIPLTTKP